MVKDMLVYFPPEGKEKLEFNFFLLHDGQRFYQFYIDNFERFKEAWPVCETYESYISEFLSPFLSRFTTIRLGVNSYDRKSTWIGLNDEGEYTLNLPGINYDFYYGAAQYRSFAMNTV